LRTKKQVKHMMTSSKKRQAEKGRETRKGSASGNSKTPFTGMGEEPMIHEGTGKRAGGETVRPAQTQRNENIAALKEAPWV